MNVTIGKGKTVHALTGDVGISFGMKTLCRTELKNKAGSNLVHSTEDVTCKTCLKMPPKAVESSPPPVGPNAVKHFAYMARVAPTEAASAYWARKVQEVA